MRRHAASVDVQEHGCAALCSIADGCNDDDEVAAIGAAGGVDVVVAAMRRHADSAAVQRHGCDALRAMAADDATRAAIVAADGIALTVSAMRRHVEMSVAYAWVDRAEYVEVGDRALNAFLRRGFEGVSRACVSPLPPPPPPYLTSRVIVYVLQHFFDEGLRSSWLRACDVIGRDVASVAVVGGAAESSGGGAAASSIGRGIATASSGAVAAGVSCALSDRLRISVVGDLCTRPRVCASVYGGMVAMFLPCQ
jgi:hypothetical protein